MLYIAIAVLIILVGLIVLALCFVRLVTVQEATAVAFKYLGRYAYCVMEFRDHHFASDDGTIVDGPGRNSIGEEPWCVWRVGGGWVFYLHPLVEPARYADYNNPDGFGEGVMVRLGDTTPQPYVSQAITASPENVPLNVEFVATMRVVNPYRWLFSSPKDVNNQVVNRMDAILRAWVRGGDQNRAQAARGDGVKLWKDIVAQGCQSVFDQLKTNWGMEVRENSIIVQDVGYDQAYQDALKAESQAKFQANASVAETAGRVLRSVAIMSGVDVDNPSELKEFMDKLKADPSLRGKPASKGGYKEAFAYAEDQVKRDRAADAGDLDDIRIGNADGTSMSGDLPGLAAAAALFGRGGGQSNRRNRSNNPAGQQRGGQTEQAAQEFFDQNGVWPYWDPKKRQPSA